MRRYIFLFGLSLLAGSCHEKKEKIFPRYQSLTESVYASGIVFPRNTYKVFALTDGYISNLLVDEGEIIKKDQVLLVLESDQQRIRLSNAEANYHTARLNSASNSPVLEELLASLQSAKSRMDNDSVNFIRYRNLLENDATSKSEYDRVALAYQTSRNDLRVLQNRYRKTEILLRNELQNARSQYRLNAEDQSNYRIRSRIDGRVYEFYREEGELVRRGEQVALIGDPKDLYLKFNIDELDIDKVKIGQVVLVKLDGYPDQIFHARLEKIYPMLNARDRTFGADASFSQPIPALQAGLTAEANIIIRQSPNALTIPRTCLIGEDSVAVERNGEVRIMPIRKGVENLEYVEVLSGLDTNSVVVKR